MYDINIQRQKLYKGILIANTLKVNLNVHKTKNALWIVTTIKVIPKTPTQKFENPIFLFRRTYKAAFRSRKKLAAIKR